MWSIRYRGSTLDGPADGRYGVFTEPSDGTVFAGSHANRFARVGVRTRTDGTTFFVECDADGMLDGRFSGCDANGDTWYSLYEHGKPKQKAVLCADGTCAYNGEVCTADFPPFVKLKAKVLPIKVHPTAHRPPIPHSPHPLAPHRPPIRPSAIFGTRRSSPGSTPPRCAPAAADLHPWPRDTAHHGSKSAPHVRPGRRTGGRVHYASSMTACVVHTSL
jgi:hypothetical protein